MTYAGELPRSSRTSGSFRRISDAVRIDIGDAGELWRRSSLSNRWIMGGTTADDILASENLFSRQSSVTTAQEDEEALQWAALEKLPTFDRLRIGVLRYIGEDGMKKAQEIDVTRMTLEDRQHIIEKILRVTEEDNERFLEKLRERLDRVGINLPKIEVRYEHLKVEAHLHIGSRSVPSIPNFFKSFLERPLMLLGASKQRHVNILSDVSGIVKPTRLTLLLGPPESGKSTLLRALAGRLDDNLQVSGEVTYNGHQMHQFVPRKTAAYISQYDLQTAELTVRENLDFYSRVQGVGNRYDMLTELSKREKEAGIKPEPDVDIYLKATSVTGQSTNLLTDYIMKLMGLDICADTRVGDAMRRGISGGQKKRVTTAEMLVGPAKALFMDEISTGLDSSTTYQIVKMLRQIVHLMESTIVVSLLQPPPETYALFDDLILLSEGQIAYQGPCNSVLEFFASVGFECPERKATADFLQEVTSRKDQRQYWADKSVPYEYVSVSKFVELYKGFHAGETVAKELFTPYDRSKSHPAALVYKRYALSKRELFKACLAREIILMKRNLWTYYAKVTQIIIIAFISSTLYLRTTLHRDSINNATVYMGSLFFCLIFIMTAGLAELSFTIMRLPVFFKEKELLLYPAWAVTVPMFLLRIPWTIVEAGVYLIIVYFITGFTPEAGRFFRLFLILVLINQSTIGLFRFAAAFSRTRVATMNFGSFLNVTTVLLGGFVLSRDSMPVWWKWASWCSSLMYGQQAVSINEFLSKEWNKPYGNTTLGIAALQHRGLETRGYWVWLSVATLAGFLIMFNIFFTLCLHFLDAPRVVRSGTLKSRTVERNGSQESIKEDHSLGVPNTPQIYLQQLSPPRLSGLSNLHGNNTSKPFEEASFSASAEYVGPSRVSVNLEGQEVSDCKKGMVLPFRPLSISFNKINYYVDMPEKFILGAFQQEKPYVFTDTMKEQGITKDRLQLLREVTGAFRPGVITALVGVSGAGKTTLMDVLAGRKTRGYVEGEIRIAGYPKKQATFARISRYCEQNDIHSPNVTVYESLVYSAWMRLPSGVNKTTRMMFVEEVMSLVELEILRDCIVGLPGESGLSTEQRKRLTIAVELVANPSIIFMDEPTSGLDARSADIVMRAVRNIGDTGRTVVCTIHQPSIDIFEAFDELLLLKRGGETIYAGPLGHHSCHVVHYFQAVPGVPKIKDGYNPATWMLEVSSVSMEAKLGVNFADVFSTSHAYHAIYGIRSELLMGRGTFEDRRNQELVQRMSIAATGSKDLVFPTVYAQPFSVQCLACLWKMSMSYWRNTTYTGVRILFTMCMGLLFGSVFWGLGKRRETQQDIFNLMGACFCSVLFIGVNSTMAVQPVVAIERIVYYRERGAGMYSPLAYAIAQFSIEWPYVLLQSILLTSIVYSMIQFEWHHAKILWFLFFMFFTLLFYTYWGLISVAATPNGQIAAILATMLFGLFNLFSGFTITRKQIPVWWRWMYWCTPVSWTLYGLIGSQLGDVQSLIFIPDRPNEEITVAQYINDYFGYKHAFLRWVALEQVALVFFLAVIFCLLIKHLNFQRR